MKRQANPTIPRLKYVANQYPDWVTMATIRAWTEAMGAHGLRDQLTRIFDYGGADAEAVVRNLANRYLADYGAPEHSEYDRYLPWAAREFNRIFKPYLKQARKRGLPEWPEGFEASSWVFGTVPDYFYDGSGISQAATKARDDARKLFGAFGSVVAWAKDEGVDLNQWQWDEAVAQAAEWTESRAAEASAGEVVYEFPDGWTVQQLASEGALESEGDAMGHCVGGYKQAEGWDPGCLFEPYDETVVEVYSLRDPAGRPHATLEWQISDDEGNEHHGYVTQLKGKQNAAPKVDYLHRMVDFRLNYLDKKEPSWRLQDAPMPEGADVFTDSPVGAFKRSSGSPVLVMYRGDPRVLIPMHEVERHAPFGIASTDVDLRFVEQVYGNLEWEAFKQTGKGSLSAYGGKRGRDEMMKWIATHLANVGLGAEHPVDFLSPYGAHTVSPRHAELKRKLMR